jgi:hypothetical protein
MFDVYVKNDNNKKPLLDFKFTGLGNDSMTMDFKTTFIEP